MNKRVEIEQEFLALLLNKNELLGVTQVKPEWLVDKNNQKILKYALECYEENENVEILKICDKHKEAEGLIDYYIELLNETFWYKNSWQNQLKSNEESIVKFYKEDIIKFLNKKLVDGQIGYDEFLEKTKQLDEIIITDKSVELNKQEILESINQEKSAIEFKNFPKLNEMLKMVQGDFLIIGATTGAGKSGLMLNMMNDLMERFQCIYFNMEMSKSTIYKRIVAIRSKVKVKNINNPETSFQIDVINQAMDEIEQAKLIVEHEANDIREIQRVLAKLKDKNRHTVLFIDHLGLTRSDTAKSLYEQATEVAKQLRQMCLKYNCTIISASQLNRAAYTSDELSLSMLKDSGELENSASKVILLYRDKKSNKDEATLKMHVEIAKNRDGICGDIEMLYNKEKQIFEEIK